MGSELLKQNVYMQKELNTAVIFRNYTSRDFSETWDGIGYVFKAGQDTYMELWKAIYFAKHLIDRELTKDGFMTNDQAKRRELEMKCVLFPTEEVKSEEILDKNMKEEAKKRPGRPKKIQEEEEFSDLKQE